MRLYRILLDSQGDSGTSSTTGEGDKGKAPDLAALVDKLVARHGSASDAVRVLVSENYKLRDDNRELKAKVPGDGVVVLSGDDAKAWAEYRAIGDPATVRKAVRDGEAAIAKSAAFERKESLAAIAEKAGVTKTAAFLKIAEDPSRYEVVKDKKTGEEKVVVKPSDEDGDPVDFAEFHKDFAPALGIEPPKGQQAPKGTPRHGHQPNPKLAATASGGDRGFDPLNPADVQDVFRNRGLGGF